MDLLLKLNVFVTSAMFGVIWVVQIVHYPMFAGIDRTDFADWHAFHSNRITYLVAPLMLAELISSVLMVWMRTDASTIVLCALTIGVWLATFFFSIPLHDALGVRDQSNRSELIRKLVLTHWIRSILYTSKIALLLWVVTVSSR